MNVQETKVPPSSVVRFATGDPAAFLEVYRAYSGPLRGWVAKFFKSPFKQEEAVQEAWLAVHRTQRAFDVNQGELRPWLRARTARRCRELLRARGRPPDAPIPLADAGDAAWLDAPGPDDVALRARLREAVERFAAGLAPGESKVLRDGTVGLEVLKRAGLDPALSALAVELLE